jgi:hypothetical protein
LESMGCFRNFHTRFRRVLESMVLESMGCFRNFHTRFRMVSESMVLGWRWV